MRWPEHDAAAGSGGSPRAVMFFARYVLIRERGEWQPAGDILNVEVLVVPARARRLLVVTLDAVLVAPLAAGTASAGPPDKGQRPQVRGPHAGFYQNPLAPAIPGDGTDGTVDSCADPLVIKSQDGEQQDGEDLWYMYCTTDPLNDTDRTESGELAFRPVPMMTSTDLVSWTYVGDAFDGVERPGWIDPTAAFWAPDVVYSSTYDRYYLFFGVTNTTISGVEDCASDNGIGVAVSESPVGPWTISDTPAVSPRQNTTGCDFFWTYDPDVLGDTVGETSVLYYGSYYGGIFADEVTFTETGATVAGGDLLTQVAVPNRYEGTNVVERNGYYYMFVSATNCCASELTGYSVFVGRSASPYGPFVDREGNSFLDAQVGGTPVISMNGNRWIGTGHNAVFQDEVGQWWTVYHAVDRTDPVFARTTDFTKRPALLDPIDWIGRWPTVRGGLWASDDTMPAPAAQHGERTAYRTTRAWVDIPTQRLLQEDFRGDSVPGGWTWVREPATGTFGVDGGLLRMQVQHADLFTTTNTAPVLLTDAPDGEYVVETAVRIQALPNDGCCYNYVQAGLVIYAGDDDFVKLVPFSLWETRQTEFAKESSTLPLRSGAPRYGNTVVGPPSEYPEWTYLRIVKEDLTDEQVLNAETELYTAYTSQDGHTWVRGGSWTHQLGDDARIGLVAMGQVANMTSGTFVAEFDDFRVSRLAERRMGRV